MPATSKKQVDPSHTIEYQRTVINDMAGDLHSIFTGTAAINAAAIQIAGDDIGSISDHLDKTIFFYYGAFDTDTSVSSPAKLAEIYSHEDATVDIADGKTVTVDDGCSLSITNTTEYVYFSNITEETNAQKLVGWADNIRTSIIKDHSLTGNIKVGYTLVPSALKEKSFQLYTPTDITYTPTTGVMVITIGTHVIQVGDTIKIEDSSLTLTCAQDNHGTNHKYPRPTDPYSGKKITVNSVTSTTVTVNVGISPNNTEHKFVSAAPLCLSTGGELQDDVSIDIDDTFTMTVDDGAVLVV
tara:strand:+ start:228 stop:1121 length:894 start_codon:yes stop_codon:yes gene_type:complete